MAVFSQDPFGGAVDYGGYLNWEKVTTPDGQVYYVVPGNPGYVYDPVLSNARGRKVFRANPQQQINAQNEAVKAEKERLKQESFIRSPAGQLLPVAGTTAGLIAANYALRPGVQAQQYIPGQGVLMSDGTIKGIGAGITPSTAADATALTETGGMASGGGFAGGAAEAAAGAIPEFNIAGTGAESMYPGGANYPAAMTGAEGTALTPGLSMGDMALGGLALGLGSYGVYQGVKEGNPMGAAMGGAGVGLGLNSLGYALGPWGWAAALAGPALLSKSGLFDHKSTKERTQENYGRLGEIGRDNAAYQNLVNQGFQESYGGLDTWDIDDDKSKAPIDLITRGYGVLNEFGPEWATLSQQQREAVVRGLVDNDLINSRKGDWLITDSDKAQEVKNNVLGGFNVGVQAANNPKQVTPGQAAAMGLPPRSSTLSPGIGLNGLPITKGPLILGR